MFFKYRFFGLSVLFSLLFLFGCGGGAGYSESVYLSSEAGIAKRVERCRVLSVREVTIVDEDSAEGGEFVGAIAGALLGHALGGTVGGGSGTDVAEAAGAIGGGLAGSYIGGQLGEASGTRKGLEYSILKSNGDEITFAQEFLGGDRVLSAGETCRVTVSGGINRVLPADYLPESVEVPKETLFE